MRDFIDKHRATHGVEPICKVLQIDPSGYRRHAALRRSPEQRCARVQRDEAQVPQKAFGNLAQGLMNNYLQFWTELSQSLAVGFSQGQSSLMRQAEVMTGEAIDATQANVRRARQAA